MASGYFLQMLPSCGIERRIGRKQTDLSEERFASTFRVEEQPRLLQRAGFLFYLLLALNMNVIGFS
jgi:hypothetical protein